MKRIRLLISVLSLSLLFSVATPIPVAAQNTDNMTRTTTDDYDDDDDDDFDWGLLGLLGLIGLAGLRRRDVDERPRVTVNRP